MDAVVRVGGRGNLEWAPMKPVLPVGWEFPIILPAGTPIVCLYHVGDVVGCATARRRLGAIVLGHFPAPRNRVELDPRVARLLDLLERYLTTRADALREAIQGLLRETGLYVAVARDLRDLERDFDRCAEALYELLRETVEESGMCGLHVYGLPSIDPEDPLGSLECMVELALRRALWSSPRVDWAAVWAGRAVDEVSRLALRVLQRFLLSARLEVENLLRALRGEYVRPGFSGSPFRYLDVAPTGRNACGYDVRRFPDELAVSAAATLALELRRTSKRVVTVMGPTDLATGGLQYALALELLGYIPVKTSFRSYVPTTTGRASYGTNLTGEVIGVLPWELPLIHVRHINVPVQVLLLRGRVTELRPGPEGTVAILDDGTARVEVILPEGVSVPLGSEVTVLGVPAIRVENVRLLCADLVVYYSEEDVVDVADLVAMPTVCGGTSACVAGVVDRVVDDRTVVLRSERDPRARVTVRFRYPIRLTPGRRAVVVGELAFDVKVARVLAVTVLREPRVRCDVLLVVSGATFQGISPSALSLINLCRMLDVISAEPWIAYALGERSYLLPTARPHGTDRSTALQDLLRTLEEWINRALSRLRERGLVPQLLRALLTRVRERLRADPVGTLRELWEGLKRLNDYVVVGLRDLVGWNLAELLWSVALGTGLWIPPSRNAPFLNWAVSYLALREALRAGLPRWLLGELTGENAPVLAAVGAFTQCPGDLTAPILPMLEAGLYDRESLEWLGLRALASLSYVILPYTRSELTGTRQPFLHCPLALALAVITSDTTLQVYDSYDDYSNLFCCGCTVGLEATIAALLDYLLKPETLRRLTLDVSRLDLGAFKPGWNLAKSAGGLARLVGWRRALLRATTELRTLHAQVERGVTGPLVATRTYLVESLLRTLLNRRFIEGLRRFGVSGALYLLRSLKRFATLGYVAAGREPYRAVLPTVWSVVREHAGWLRSVPAALASAAFFLVRISRDLGVTYPREVLSWVLATSCCCPELCAFQVQAVARLAAELLATVPMIGAPTPVSLATATPATITGPARAPGPAPAPATLGPTVGTHAALEVPVAGPAVTPAVLTHVTASATTGPVATPRAAPEVTEVATAAPATPAVTSTLLRPARGLSGPPSGLTAMISRPWTREAQSRGATGGLSLTGVPARGPAAATTGAKGAGVAAHRGVRATRVLAREHPSGAAPYFPRWLLVLVLLAAVGTAALFTQGLRRAGPVGGRPRW